MAGLLRFGVSLCLYYFHLLISSLGFLSVKKKIAQNLISIL
jgi:hypothetical protein